MPLIPPSDRDRALQLAAIILPKAFRLVAILLLVLFPLELIAAIYFGIRDLRYVQHSVATNGKIISFTTRGENTNSPT